MRMSASDRRELAAVLYETKREVYVRTLNELADEHGYTGGAAVIAISRAVDRALRDEAADHAAKITDTFNAAFADWSRDLPVDITPAAAKDAYALWVDQRQEWSAPLVGVTEAASAHSDAVIAFYRDAGLPEPEYDFLTAAGGREAECEVCRALIATNPHSADEVRALGTVHPNCFPPQTPVLAPSAAHSMSRPWEGELAVVRTASGRELSATPNHPVLTRRGWVALGEVQQGDHLLRVRGADGRLDGADPVSDDSSASPHENRVPTSIGEIHRLALVALELSARPIPFGPKDFHGDTCGRDGEVQVVDVEGELRNRLDADCGKLLSEFALAVSDLRIERLASGGSAALQFDGVPSAPHGRMCHLHALDAAPRGEAPVAEEIAHGSERNTKRLRGFRGRASRLKVRIVSLLGRDPDLPAALALPKDPHPGLSQPAGDGGVAHPDIAGQPANRLPGFVSADEVIGVDVVPYSGHVHNIQTSSHWYVASGFIVHNCQHSWRPRGVKDGDLPKRIVVGRTPGGILGTEPIVMTMGGRRQAAEAIGAGLVGGGP